MNTDTPANNKRIAKNTIVLYFRMVFMMVIALITSRVVLSTLGESDYGIYNVVGGFVAMFTIISGSLSAAISRFITFELGKGSGDRLRKIFSTSVNVQIIISVIIVVLCEAVGIWFLNNKMNIPADRMYAANWVLQCSILSFVVNLISVPYNAAIVAHEKMSAFAYISIVDALLKLGIVYLLWISDIDKLILYALLLLVISVVMRMIYGIYCNRKFEECHYELFFDKSMLKDIFKFAGWTFLGEAGFILNSQGITLLVNMFFGVTANAARGLASQVNSLVQQFTRNFTTAINPQITKNYADGDLSYMHSLIVRAAKFSYYLYLLIALPLIFESDIVLVLWLKDVPEYTSIFTKWTIICSSTTILANPLIAGISATGDIKKYYIIASSITITVLPITYIVYKLDGDVTSAYIVYFIVYLFLLFIRTKLICPKIEMPLRMFYIDVLLKVLFVTIASLVVPVVLSILVKESYFRLFLMCLLCTISTAISSYYLGLTRNERSQISKIVLRKLHK